MTEDEEGRAPVLYPAGTIPALAALFDDLTSTGISWCSWKSNEHMEAGLAGRTDVDLLIGEDDADPFSEIARKHDLKTLVPRRRTAGIHHLLGMDRASGQLFHLHVHERLVAGDRHVKCLTIPLERAFLASARPLNGVPLPAPALELSVLAVRALLKYCTRDVVKDVLRIRSPGLKDDMLREIEWLLDRTTPDEVRATLEATERVLDPELVCAFLEAITRDRRDGPTFSRLRRRLRRSKHLGGVRARAAYVAAAWRARRRFRFLPPDRRMRPGGGGVGIALLGSDGSGKSTLAKALAQWLGWKVSAQICYLGSNPPSRRSRMLYLAFRAFRRAHRVYGTVPGVTRAAGGARDLALCLHLVSIGRDRLRWYRAGRRALARGRVVIFDRFPLRAGSDADPVMPDGPRIRRMVGDAGPLVSALARAEERIYERFVVPGRVLVLRVDPAVAARRKPDHALATLKAKSRAAEMVAPRVASAHPETTVHEIDANDPFDIVLLEAKSWVWDAL